MVFRSDGTSVNYPDFGSQPNVVSASNGRVAAIDNKAIVLVSANGLKTIATPRQAADLVPGAMFAMDDNGIAIDPHGNVYVNQDFLVGRRGCTDVIFEIHASGRIQAVALRSRRYLRLSRFLVRGRSGPPLGA
jgi:hypothetical protein